MVIEWGVATRRLAGEDESGDAYVVSEHDGSTLFGVIDGLGHGHDAAVASGQAASVLNARSEESDLVALMQACHGALRTTRGAVISLAAFEEGDATLSWVGVGDVSAVLVRADPGEHKREYLMLRGGIVGLRLPRLAVEVLPVFPGDTLVMTTDGIRSIYVESLDDLPAPQAAADRILQLYGRGHDDALVLVARFRES